MTVKELLNNENFTALTLPDEEREITGVYIGDLLSWVMGKATAGDAWITIMSNINTVAVATLTDVSCIILAEGVTLSEDIAKTAFDKGVNVILTNLSGYSTAVQLSKLI